MKTGMVSIKNQGGKFSRVGISELSDNYLIAALRRMEQRLPEYQTDGYATWRTITTEDVGFVEDFDEIEDDGELRNYEMFKLEAETRGLSWRVHPE